MTTILRSHECPALIPLRDISCAFLLALLPVAGLSLCISIDVELLGNTGGIGVFCAMRDKTVPAIHPGPKSFSGGYEEYFFLPRPNLPFNFRVQCGGCAIGNSSRNAAC